MQQLEFEKLFINAKFLNLPNKKFGFEFTVHDQKIVLTPEQIFASFLKLISLNFSDAGFDSNELVISVPAYFSNTERQAVLDAAEIANIHCVRLINESTAVALTYEY